MRWCIIGQMGKYWTKLYKIEICIFCKKLRKTQFCSV
nr:MAG TPA: hypothetical protein [Caudoviricetes sp.]DAZ46026.1 MAG TPA: hypothetical protein [Caudoviricetes sp.]